VVHKLIQLRATKRGLIATVGMINAIAFSSQRLSCQGADDDALKTPKMRQSLRE